MPVSKRRKPKKKAGGGRKHVTAAQADPLGVAAGVWEQGLMGVGVANRRRNQPSPEWVKRESAAVLADTGRFADAGSMRELEAMICDVFAEAFAEDAAECDPAWFPLFAMELINGASQRSAEAVRDGSDRWRGPLFLLRGLESAMPEHYRRTAEAAARKVVRALPEADRASLPSGLDKPMAATGRVWTLVNAYGDETGLIGAFTDPIDGAETVYLMNFDASRFPHVSYAGAFDSLEAAVEAWRGHAEGGEAAEAKAVDASTEMAFAAYADDPVAIAFDGPDRTVLAEYFRSARRLADMTASLRRDGVQVPAAESRYEPVLLDPVIERFGSWLEGRGVEHDPDALFVIAEQFVLGAVPGSELSVSPRRVEHGAILIADMYKPEGIRDVFALLPEWIRYCGEQTGLDTTRIEAAVAAAPKSPEEARRRDPDLRED
jgi:hypothetical protein